MAEVGFSIDSLKTALLKCAGENAGRQYCTGNVIVSDICKDAVIAIDYLLKELEKEKKLNEEIKVRFVKCNTCTEEMKSKCLMFNENLCEGERCEELVDLVALVNDSGDKAKIARGKELIRKMLGDLEAWREAYPDCEETSALVTEGKKFLEEE